MTMMGSSETADNNAFLARHQFAKHLYVLMMAIKPAGVKSILTATPTNNNPAETAYGIAQWAINAVDFRDADSIMTPFEFAINPVHQQCGPKHTGWDVDGILGTARRRACPIAAWSGDASGRNC